MHSANSILAQTILEHNPKIIESIWDQISEDTCGPSSSMIERASKTRESFFEILMKQLENVMDQEIIFSPSERIVSYHRLSLMIRNSIRLLQLPPEEYVLFLGPNSLDYLSLYFGTIGCGSIPIPLPMSQITIQDIRTFLIQHTCHYIVISEEFDPIWLRKLLESSSALIRKVFIYDSTSESREKLIKSEKIVPINLCIDYCEANDIQSNTFEPNDLNLCLAVNRLQNNQWPPIFCLYNHQSMVYTCELLRAKKIFDCNTNDIVLCYGPFEQQENLLMFLLGLMNKSTIVLVPNFDSDKIQLSIQKFQINTAMLSSNYLLQLLKEDLIKTDQLNSLTKVFVFGERFAFRFHQKLLNIFKNVKLFRSFLSVPETPYPITLMSFDSKTKSTLETPLPGTRIKVIDGNRNILEADRLGLICIERDFRCSHKDI
ncbi:hypothetical protein SSS_05427 [Sarcoptes scabiei]|uniref:AMP-dependent synthetase/ligase domain-containing protein n=1 Tax=Sarcoptes scabiei TaxID=52283 RepID=A0A834V9V8_SARSC|nr:hypothetical protein SSS_05427 [Sarcoptes scabiei]